MDAYIVKILDIERITHDVVQLRIEKPAEYNFVPGQATEVAINQGGWIDERRPFTFTNLPGDKYLEFIIKTYPLHNGVTNQINKLRAGEELVIGEPWGTIEYKGEGIFIAGGAGITPFISIFRQLAAAKRPDSNHLIFANRKRNDIILKDVLEAMPGLSVTNILSEEFTNDCHYGFVTETILKNAIRDKNDKLYVCGPPPMMSAVTTMLHSINITNDSIIMEL